MRAWLTALEVSLLRPERWALLAACEWVPDADGFPTDRAALLAADTCGEP